MKNFPRLLVAALCLASPCFSQPVTRTTSASAPAATQIYYGGGPIMSGSTNVYVVYYGTWSTTSQNIINTWLQHLGGTFLYNINTTYHDSTGAGVQNVVNYNPTTNSYQDNYSLGKSLTDASIQTIVSNAIRGGHLPNDATNGVYFVLTAADVSQSSSNGTLCQNYCGYHSPSNSIMTGETIKYSIVGNFAACPSTCDGNIFNHDTTTPNGDIGGDGAVNVMFHELSETVSDPNVTLSNGAWGDLVTGESGDMCNFNFGTWSTLPQAANGAHYDVTISGVNYLIQQMFLVSAPTHPVAGTDYTGTCQISTLSCTPSYSCTQQNGMDTTVANITLSCNAASNISVSATACRVNGCTSSSNQGNVSSLSTSAQRSYLPGTDRGCGFSWTWGGTTYTH